MSNEQTIKASVVPWEACAKRWGVSIDFPDGSMVDYEVGSKSDAEAECRRIKIGDAPSCGPLAGQVVAGKG
jgi:hypothetical protein